MVEIYKVCMYGRYIDIHMQYVCMVGMLIYVCIGILCIYRVCTDMSGCVWVYMTIIMCISRVCIGLHGYIWVCMVLYG